MTINDKFLKKFGTLLPKKFVLILPSNSMTLAFKYFFFANRLAMKLNGYLKCLKCLFLITFQISLYFFHTSSSLIKKDMFFPPFSKYFMYAIICGKIIHNGLTI